MISPLVSVLMPVYNGEKYLVEAVESILAQTYQKFELIAIDDGSTDHSIDILKKYRSQDKRVVIYQHPKNKGIVAALNAGIKIMQGEYIARMDADDISLPERLEKQVAYMGAHPDIGVAGTWAEVIDDQRRHIGVMDYPYTNTLIQWALCFYCPIIHPAVIARRAEICSAGGYRSTNPHTEDYELWARLSPKTHFANLPERLILLRKHPANITNKNKNTQMENSATISRGLIHIVTGQPCKISPLELAWAPRRISSAELKELTTLIRALGDHFLSQPDLTHFEKRYLRRQTTVRLTRLAQNAPSFAEGFGLLTQSLMRDPLALIEITRVVIRKTIG